MAGFKTHLTGGIVVGVASATSAFSLDGPLILQFVGLSSLGTLGGILPDLDSDTGRPVKLLFGLVSSLLVLITISSLLSQGSTLATIAASVAFVYFASLAAFFVGKKITVHRGIMHSVPFALFAGFIAAISASAILGFSSLWAGIAAFGGVLSHLLLDELNSLGLHYKCIPYIKTSFGTALKLKSKSFPASCLLYASTIVLAAVYLVFF